MNREDKEMMALITAFIVGMLVTISPQIISSSQQEEQPPAKATIGIPKIAVTTPDTSYAFEVKENREKAKATMDELKGLKEKIDSLEFPTTEMKLTSLGTYYITGYTSSECGGSTTTASGATCHKASYEDRLTEPTTCAIDQKLHDFGDLFYIAEFDTVYVAEDTGSAVKGKHLDLYYFDSEYSQVLQITGYYEVFSVEYEYGSEPASKYSILPKINEEELP